MKPGVANLPKSGVRAEQGSAQEKARGIILAIRTPDCLSVPACTVHAVHYMEDHLFNLDAATSSFGGVTNLSDFPFVHRNQEPTRGGGHPRRWKLENLDRQIFPRDWRVLKERSFFFFFLANDWAERTSVQPIGDQEGLNLQIIELYRL